MPTITGANADEGGACPQPTTTAQDFERQARQRYGEAADEFLKLYPAATDEAAKLAQNQSARDVARTTLYMWAITRVEDGEDEGFHVLLESPASGP